MSWPGIVTNIPPSRISRKCMKRIVQFLHNDWQCKPLELINWLSLQNPREDRKKWLCVKVELRICYCASGDIWQHVHCGCGTVGSGRELHLPCGQQRVRVTAAPRKLCQCDGEKWLNSSSVLTLMVLWLCVKEDCVKLQLTVRSKITLSHWFRKQSWKSI